MHIELLEQEPSTGEYCALVSVGEDMLELTRRYGSWTTLPDPASGKFREVLPTYAAALQTAVNHQIRRAA